MKPSTLLFGYVKTALLLAPLLVPARVVAQETSFTNPAPTTDGAFGSAMTALGTDRVVIGAAGATNAGFQAGAAYLFNTTGVLLSTFTNPAPKAGAAFGNALATIGADRVLIGAENADLGAVDTGAAYLFSTNGTLLLTLTNPTPQDFDRFGCAVATVGRDRLLIGAFLDNTGASEAGAAYLFSTNGALLMTFTNPTPAGFEYFGYSVAALGSDRVVIGADSAFAGGIQTGEAYLFNTNGTLLKTFLSPIAQGNGQFGRQVAAVGNDRVLISAPTANAGALYAGAAYLFNTNGTLLTTFTNPTPIYQGFFGISVAAVGSTRVLIGAELDNQFAAQTGAAFLFSTNGTLLTVFTNPAPALDDDFGDVVSAIGTDQVIIGAPYDRVGGADSGSAFLYSLPYPSLSIAKNGGPVSVSWVTPETGISLQQTSQLNLADWSNATEAVSLIGQTNLVQQTSMVPSRFFRLQRQ